MYIFENKFLSENYRRVTQLYAPKFSSATTPSESRDLVDDVSVTSDDRAAV
jgi:hypothetical protein